MKKYTPRQLAKELNIENKQEMRNILRDYVKLLNPVPSNFRYDRRTKDGTKIECGPYMTYDDDDLMKLRQILMFKRLGVKPSEIIKIMQGKEKESAIDKLIGMLEEREKEIKAQLIMARSIRALGGLKSVGAEILLGKTPKQYVEEMKESLRDQYSMRFNLGIMGRFLSREELESSLREVNCLEIPEIKEYMESDEFAIILKHARFDMVFFEKLLELIMVLGYYEKSGEDEYKIINDSIQGFVNYTRERYGIIGIIDFGLLWMVYKEGLFKEIECGENEQTMIEVAIKDYIVNDMREEQELIMACIMSWFPNLLDHCVDLMKEVFEYIKTDQSSEAAELIHSFVCEDIGISNREDLNHFELYLRVLVEQKIREEPIEEEELNKFELLLSKFYGILHECLNNA